ncbi:Nramp family divalent metal transporter [Clostridium coskatii]|uniref:Divalent metal cation transporter MntH n=1 Tax=Clostridium coskatii TaxID=1705578 RepID=A0A166SRN3_9CLOT|nr:Nramp family divalent metal transporter [Clostridium coskatii]OAA92688.1 Divalent metal cation transporter MntH [Clostridium coskatii]OBR94614.1 divalent metal cation transporter MntH [Clostridium coskatii]
MENELNVLKKNRGLLGKSRELSKFLGPAFIVSVAYIDPGNFATNISAGSKFNYTLLWVILWSNIMAIFLQSMSAKLGIATGHNLPEMCGMIFSKKANWFLWICAELAAMATDLAEFLGGTLGLYLLFKIPMIYAGLLTGLATYIIVYMEKYGQRIIEAIITTLVTVICIAYSMELFIAKPDWTAVGIHTLVPILPNGSAVLIAVSMLGATVMPHVIYLHSQLVQSRNHRNDSIKAKLSHLKMERIDIIIAMNIAFIVNAAMVIVSAAVFYKNGIAVDSIEQAHKSLEPLVGSLSSGIFGIALIASGLSSSAVGTLAGQTIMKGFVNLNIPLNVRRLITMTPAMVIICLGMNPMKALVLSQVALSFALPLAIIPMLLITSRKDLMGNLVNKPLTKTVGWIITCVIIGLNALLICLTFTGNV